MNLSVTGAFIRTNSVFRPGTTIQAEFEFPDRDTQFWMPFGFAEADLQNVRNHYLQVVARRRPDVDVDAARSEMESLAAVLGAELGGDNPNHGAYVASLKDEMVGDTRALLVAVMWVSAEHLSTLL